MATSFDVNSEAEVEAATQGGLWGAGAGVTASSGTAGAPEPDIQSCGPKKSDLLCYKNVLFSCRDESFVGTTAKHIIC